jgi:hypothetical protein
VLRRRCVRPHIQQTKGTSSVGTLLRVTGCLTVFEVRQRRQSGMRGIRSSEGRSTAHHRFHEVTSYTCLKRVPSFDHAANPLSFCHLGASRRAHSRSRRHRCQILRPCRSQPPPRWPQMRLHNTHSSLTVPRFTCRQHGQRVCQGNSQLLLNEPGPGMPLLPSQAAAPRTGVLLLLL